MTRWHRADRDVKRAEARDSSQRQPAQPVIQHAPQTIVYQGAPTITAMQVRKEKEAELFANDQYWANRLKNQEAEFLKNSKIMEQEFTDTVSPVTFTCVRIRADRRSRCFSGGRSQATLRNAFARQSTSAVSGLKE